MKQLTCEMCGGTDLVKDGGVFICQTCGCKYTVEEAKRMMIEGTVDVQGTVKVDNSAFVQKYLENARRALSKNDWEEVEKYYNMVEQNVPNNMEAVFFSSFGKAMLSFTSDNFLRRDQVFGVLIKSTSIISDCYETTTEDKEKTLRLIGDYVKQMNTYDFVYARDKYRGSDPGAISWHTRLLDKVKAAYITELKQISEKHDDAYIKELINKHEPAPSPSSGGCYVATAVYGSYDCPQVWTLRRFRDYTLAETWYGRAFIRTYYAISPTLVKWFGHTEWFKKMWKGKLDHMVANLKADGVEDTPYEDRNW